MNVTNSRKRVFADEKIELGYVEKLSLQGDFLYAVVRSEGIYFRREDDSIAVKDTFLFGSEGVPEQDLLLSDVLIPTDILPSMMTMNVDFFLNRKVEVIIHGGFPRLVLLSRCASYSSPRKITPEDLSFSRNATKTGKLTPLGEKYLESIGYDKVAINSIKKELYSTVSNGPDVLTYGDSMQWDLNLASDNKNKKRKDMTTLIDRTHVFGLSEVQQRTKSCYIPILSIGGKL